MGKFATTEEAVAYVLGKSFSYPLGKGFTLSKSYTRPDGTLVREGWISTPKKDIDRDVIEPEAFAGEGLADYMRRGSPLSVEHNTRTLPVGFLAKSVLMRDGKVFQEENRNKNEEHFMYLPDEGTGWYGLAVIYNKEAIQAIQKNVISSFSWIAMPTEWEELEDGGRRFSKTGSISPIIETTITAYPVNTEATMRLAKARGYGYQIDKKKVTQLLLNPLVVDAVVDILVPPGTASSVIEEMLDKHRFDNLNAAKGN